MVEGMRSRGGSVCDGCGGAIPATMAACPVCEPDVVLSSGAGAAGGGGQPWGSTASRRSVPLAPALAVLRDAPALLLPPLLAVGGVATVGTYWLSRVNVWPFWLVEILLMLLVIALTLAAGIFALTFARAITVAGVAHHFAGVHFPVATAVRQVARRAVSTISWTFMHGMTSLVLAISLAMSRHELYQMQPGADGVKNSQYVWQVMFGEDAGLARAMDRSAALVRAQLAGSRRFSLLLALLVGGAGIVWVAILRASGAGLGLGLPWLSSLVVVSGAVAVWATLADVIDTAAWRLAYTGQAPPPFTRGQLGGDGLDLPRADA